MVVGGRGASQSCACATCGLERFLGADSIKSIVYIIYVFYNTFIWDFGEKLFKREKTVGNTPKHLFFRERRKTPTKASRPARPTSVSYDRGPRTAWECPLRNWAPPNLTILVRIGREQVRHEFDQIPPGPRESNLGMRRCTSRDVGLAT